MSILLYYEMVVISVIPTSHLTQSRDLVFRSGGGDLETSDGDIGSGDGGDDIRSSHDSQSMLLLYLYYVILDVLCSIWSYGLIMLWDGPHGSHGWVWWHTSPGIMYGTS